MTKPVLHAVENSPSNLANTTPDPALITHNDVREAFQMAFRRRVGRGKVSQADLADAIDVDARSVKGWFDGPNVPQATPLIRLCAYLGPTFASELLAPAGLGGVETVTRGDADPHGTVADLAKALSDISERLRDGQFCHVDRAVMAPALRDLAARLEAQARAMEE